MVIDVFRFHLCLESGRRVTLTTGLVEILCARTPESLMWIVARDAIHGSLGFLRTYEAGAAHHACSVRDDLEFPGRLTEQGNV